jgi:hypothetical protein
MNTPPLSFDNALEEALQMQNRGFSLEEIYQKYPQFKDDLQKILHIPALFSVELEYSVPRKDLLHNIIASLPIAQKPRQIIDDPIKKRSRTSFFTLVTYYISDSMNLSKILIGALIIVFLISGVVLYKQLYPAPANPVGTAATANPLARATAKPTANPATLKSSANIDDVTDQLLQQASDAVNAAGLATPDDSKEGASAQTTDAGLNNLQ